MFLKEGERLAMMKVRVLPVSDYWSSLVSFDYLKAPVAFFLSPLESAYITLPRVVRERLIFFSYLS